MRRLLLATALLAAPLVSAQVAAPATDALAPSPDSGLYSEVGIGGGYGGSGVGAIVGGSAAVGYRLPSGLAVGGHLTGYQIGDDHTGLAFGPEVRLSRPLDARTSVDLYASGTIGLYSGTAFETSGLRATGIGAAIGATATRRFDLGGGVRIATTGGLAGGVSRAFDQEVPGVGLREGGAGAYAGVVVGAQVEFKALGGRFAIGPVLEIPVVSTGVRSSIGTQPYRAGGGPTRGFITFTF